jgi:DNA-binding NarL/FixJ family response regulator
MSAAPTSEIVSVWLIEDHDDFRKMVAWQVNQLSGLRCSRQFTNCEDALGALKKETPPRVILCDIGLPGMDGITGIRRIKIASPQTHVIVLTVYDDHDKVFNAICAGASGYLLKNDSEEGIASAVLEVLNGGAPVNPRVARLVLQAFARMQPASSGNDYNLSAREKDILELMVKGLIKKEIADKLGISFHTVNNQLRSIYQKLHVHTLGAAVAKALNERLL